MFSKIKIIVPSKYFISTFSTKRNLKLEEIFYLDKMLEILHCHILVYQNNLLYHHNYHLEF